VAAYALVQSEEWSLIAPMLEQVKQRHDRLGAP
jgi:hypothetical protein